LRDIHADAVCRLLVNDCSGFFNSTTDNFEQLEMAGQSQLPPGVEQLARLIHQDSRKS
jgi:hypothetical protein